MEPNRRARHWTKVACLALLAALLPGLVLRQLHHVRDEIDVILDDGVTLLDRTEQLLQTLLDLRAGVLTSLIPGTEADRHALALELSGRLAVLDRQNDRLAELEVRDLLHEDEEDELKALIDLTEASVQQIIDQCREPTGDMIVSLRSATDVSAQIDACAAELHVLSTRVAARARVADSEIPQSLRAAEALTVALAITCVFLAVVALIRTRSPVPVKAAPPAGIVMRERQQAVVPPRSGDPDRLRIVHVLTHTDATRGGAIQALLLAREQQQRGHDVEVVANLWKPGNPIHETFRAWMDAGLPLRFYAMDHPQGVWCPPGEALRFRSYLRARRPDVVHVHRDKALLFSLLASTGLDVPAFVSQRGTTHAFRHRAVAIAHRSRRVHRIIAVAEAVKDALVAQRVDPRKVSVVYGSCDVERFDPERIDASRLRVELGIGDETPLVVVLGELSNRKDPRTYIHAFGELLRTRPDVQFVHAGHGTRRNCERFQALGREVCGDRLRFLGWRADVPEILAAADVVVNASARDEGLTGTVREALAMARPVVCTATDGNPELVIDGQTGLLVPPRDPPALAAAIDALLRDPERAARMGRRGREKISSEMTLAVREARMMHIYREILATRAAERS